MNRSVLNLTACRIAEYLDHSEPKKIPAIKELRAIKGTDWSLLEAKNIVDSHKGEYYQNVHYFTEVITNRLNEMQVSEGNSLVEVVTTVRINLGGVIHTLTFSQARALHTALTAALRD